LLRRKGGAEPSRSSMPSVALSCLIVEFFCRVCRIVPHSLRSRHSRPFVHAALHRVENAIAPNAGRCCIAMARLSLCFLSVCPHTKDVDLLILIGYNLSNWTGFEARPEHRRSVLFASLIAKQTHAPDACGIAPQTSGMHETKSLTYEVRS
jgi:hypothetical protein